MNKKDFLENAKVNVSSSENDEKKIISNLENTDSENDQRKINTHLIYLKSDKNKKVPKKNFLESNSDISFQEKNNKKETNRTLIKKYESKIEQITNQLEDYKRKYLEQRQNNLDLEQELKLINLEKEKITRINNIEIEKTKEKNLSLEEQNKRLIIKNEDLQKKLDEASPKVWKFDEIDEKYKKLLADHKNILETNKTLNELFNENKSRKNEIDSEYNNLKLENQILKQNNEILKKNSMVNENKIKEQNEKINELENDIRDIRKINQNYIEKLTDKNINIDNTYKDKVNKELNDMKNRYESDIYNLKKHYDDINEKKTSYLKEERDEYKTKCNKYEKILKEKDDTLNLVQNELRNLNSKSTEQITFLKLQLNTKTEELNSRIAIYEEQISALTIFKNENEALNEKNNFLRTEMIKMQSDHKTEIAEYKIRLNVLEEKLKNYDNMENELDNVINQAPQEEGDDQEIVKVIRGMPTSNKRRIDQCLNLANKVKMLSVENEKLKIVNDKINTDLLKLRDECNIYKNVADKVKQPNSYFVTCLQEKEMEIYKLKQDIIDKEQENKKLKLQCESYKEAINKMENDMKTLVNNRKKIEELNNILSNYINNEKNNNYNIKDITEYTNNFNNNLNNQFNPSFTQNNFSMTASSGFGRPKPERDINYNEIPNEVINTPEWYKKLKKKNK
jgi:CII-binding regulator of phage lambda lysogenization HflD